MALDTTTQAGGTPSALPNNFVGSSTGEAAKPQEAPAASPETPATAPARTPVARPAMPDEALRARLERARKQERENILKSIGVDSPEKVKADLEELKHLREESEKSNREKMTREQQLQSDLEKERTRYAELEAKFKEESTSRVYEKQDAKINDIASKYIATTGIKLKSARREFAEYVESLPKSAVARMGEKDIEKWFAKFAKENPEFAKPSDEPAPEAPKAAPKTPPAPVRKPAGASTPVKKSQPAPASPSQDPSMSPQGKTLRPGQANSMSKAELKAELQRRGIRSW